MQINEIIAFLDSEIARLQQVKLCFQALQANGNVSALEKHHLPAEARAPGCMKPRQETFHNIELSFLTDEKDV